MQITNERAHREAVAEYHRLEAQSDRGVISRIRDELLAAIAEYEMRYTGKTRNLGQTFRH